MELVLVFLLICIKIYIEDHPGRRKLEKGLYHGCNVGLQYIYTIDEWYKLRKDFDSRIEKYWNQYKENAICEDEYKKACVHTVQLMIGKENQDRFHSLYELGVRNGAIRTARAGYNPGLTPNGGMRLEDLEKWVPETYAISYQPWCKCIPGKANFLTMYPDKWELDYMYVGHVKGSRWESGKFEEYRSYDMFSGMFGEKARKELVDILVNRGYNGTTYENEPLRSFDGMSHADIQRKYKYVLNDYRLNYEDVEMNSYCVSGPKKKYFYNL